MNVQLQSDVTVVELKNLKASTEKFDEKIRLKMEVHRHIERLQLNKRLVEALHEQVQFGKEKLHHVKAEYDSIKVVASQIEEMVAMKTIDKVQSTKYAKCL
jgi:tRNA U55 pseudouridine synthase TruB